MSNQLPDLEDVVKECERRLALITTAPIIVSEELLNKICDVFKNVGGFLSVDVIGGHTFCIVTPEKYSFTVSVQELPRCWAVLPYVEPIIQYEAVVELMPSFLGYKNRTGEKPKQEIFGKIPSTEWRTSSDPKKKIDPEKIENIDKFLSSQFSGDPTSYDRFKKFLENPSWSRVSKKLNRDDWIESAIVSVGQWLNEAAGKRGDLVLALSKLPNFDEEFGNVVKVSNRVSSERVTGSSERINGAENVIYYGAPGTGKSHAAKVEGIKHKARIFRTLFHPDMQNSDFFGSLKPAVVDGGAVSYKFRAGPFAKALLYARENPAERVHLVIEELNRAMAAAVFGELFQLLDRDEEGASEYEVDAPSEEFAEWYGEPTFKLPSNLWIYATMNSADQGVYPLDTAFRRRWRQVYIPIDYTIAPTNTVRVAKAGAPDATISWPVFVEKLNAFLTGTKEINTPEDRLVGPRFLKKSELAEGILPGKLLIYLWDDLLRHHDRDMLFLDTIKTYGDLDKANRDGKQIFNPVFLERLIMNPSIAQAG